jgi:hypothetical protein
MKIILPENQSDITLEQEQKYTKLLERNDLDIYSANRRKLVIFTNLTFQETAKVSQVDFEDCLTQIDKALSQEVTFLNRFTMNGTEFGFITNFDKLSSEEQHALDGISFGEFVDTEKYNSSLDDIHKLMAILFRPIVKSDSFGNYDIAEYNGTNEWCEYMKQTPLNIVKGALFFFTNLSTELESYILKYTSQEQAKGMTI